MSSAELNDRARRELDGVDETRKKKRRKLKIFGQEVFNDGRFDIIYMVLVLVILTIGLVMLFSASYITAKYSSKSDYDAYFYIKKQLIFTVIGLLLMFFIARLNTGFIKLLTIPVAVISFILLVVVLIHPYEVAGKEGIRRWLQLPLIGTFQPSDVAKLGLIMFYAWMLEKYRKKLEKKWWLQFLCFAILAVVCVLVLFEKHLSGTILMFIIGMCMLYLGGIDNRLFFALLGVLVVGGTAVILLRHRILPEFQAQRIDSFFNKDYNDTNTRWQTNQSLFALGSGGFFGLGLGNSRQKHMFLPEPQNDFIFAIVGEELGFLRSVVILLIFAIIVWRGFVIATRSRSIYDKLLAFGISVQVGIQTILNILVVTDLIPNTGISLPFFSYGGTALIIQLVEMGMVLSVSGHKTEKRVR